MPKVARIGDPVDCGSKGIDTMADGSGNVFANGIPVSRQIVDYTAGHCGAPPINFPNGSSTVFVNTMEVLRVGDAHNTHKCSGDSNPHGGEVDIGSPDVYVGG